MSLILLTYQTSSGESVDVKCDVIIRRSTSFRSEVTRHPVEDGSTTSDNATIEPAELNMDLLRSDTPLHPDKDEKAAGTDVTPSQEAYAALHFAMSKRLICSVFTARAYFDRMMITSLTENESASEQGGLFASISLVQIILATTEEATCPPPEPADPYGAARANATKLGMQNTIEVTLQEPGLTNQAEAADQLDGAGADDEAANKKFDATLPAQW